MMANLINFKSNMVPTEEGKDLCTKLINKIHKPLHINKKIKRKAELNMTHDLQFLNSISEEPLKKKIPKANYSNAKNSKNQNCKESETLRLLNETEMILTGYQNNIDKSDEYDGDYLHQSINAQVEHIGVIDTVKRLEGKKRGSTMVKQGLIEMDIDDTKLKQHGAVVVKTILSWCKLKGFQNQLPEEGPLKLWGNFLQKLIDKKNKKISEGSSQSGDEWDSVGYDDIDLNKVVDEIYSKGGSNEINSDINKTLKSIKEKLSEQNESCAFLSEEISKNESLYSKKMDKASMEPSSQNQSIKTIDFFGKAVAPTISKSDSKYEYGQLKININKFIPGKVTKCSLFSNTRPSQPQMQFNWKSKALESNQNHNKGILNELKNQIKFNSEKVILPKKSPSPKKSIQSKLNINYNKKHSILKTGMSSDSGSSDDDSLDSDEEKDLVNTLKTGTKGYNFMSRTPRQSIPVLTPALANDSLNKKKSQKKRKKRLSQVNQQQQNQSGEEIDEEDHYSNYGHEATHQGLTTPKKSNRSIGKSQADPNKSNMQLLSPSSPSVKVNSTSEATTGKVCERILQFEKNKHIQDMVMNEQMDLLKNKFEDNEYLGFDIIDQSRKVYMSPINRTDKGLFRTKIAYNCNTCKSFSPTKKTNQFFLLKKRDTHCNEYVEKINGMNKLAYDRIKFPQKTENLIRNNMSNRMDYYFCRENFLNKENLVKVPSLKTRYMNHYGFYTDEYDNNSGSLNTKLSKTFNISEFDYESALKDRMESYMNQSHSNTIKNCNMISPSHRQNKFIVPEFLTKRANSNNSVNSLGIGGNSSIKLAKDQKLELMNQTSQTANNEDFANNKKQQTGKQKNINVKTNRNSAWNTLRLEPKILKSPTRKNLMTSNEPKATEILKLDIHKGKPVDQHKKKKFLFERMQEADASKIAYEIQCSERINVNERARSSSQLMESRAIVDKSKIDMFFDLKNERSRGKDVPEFYHTKKVFNPGMMKLHLKKRI